MPIVARHHAWTESGHRPLKVWPEDCLVQWGGNGVVLSNRAEGAYRTAFFEVFPAEGGFIRGEGATVIEAEAAAFRQFTAQAGCDHLWPRGNYTNGGARCRRCGAFETRFRPIVRLGEWRKPLSPSLLDMIASGDFRRSAAEPDVGRFQRKAWLRARRMGIDLPDFDTAPPAPVNFEEDDYARACRRAVVAWLQQNRGAIEQGETQGVTGLFDTLHRNTLRLLLEEADRESAGSTAS